MRLLRQCPALACGVLLACAQQHEGSAIERDPAQTSTISETDESAESNEAMNAPPPPTSAPPADEEPRPPPAGGSGHTPPPLVPPPPPASPPVSGIFPGTGEVCARRVFDSLTPAALVQVLSPCTYRMVGWPSLGEPQFMRVTIDGALIPLGHADFGWRIADDGQGITLLGSACEAAQAGASIAIIRECVHPIAI